MAPLKLMIVAGVVAGVGCGGNLPGGGIGPPDAHVAVDTAVDVTVAIDTSTADTGHADVGSESSCPIGMNCGSAPWALMRVDGTCMFLTRCFVAGGFDRIGVLVDDSQVPMSPSEGWTYSDASNTAIELHGQVCSDLMSGAAMTVAIYFTCPA